MDIFVSFLFLIFILFTPLIIINLILIVQKLIMKLSCKALHFVPMLSFAVLFLYEYLRGRGVIVYYSDVVDAGFSSWVFCLFFLFCFLISLVTLIVVYIRDRRRLREISGKKGKFLAVAAIILLIAFSGHYAYKMLSYDYGQDTSVYHSQKLHTVGGYMLDRLNSGEYDVSSVFLKDELLDSIDSNKYSDAYYAVKFFDFDSIGFWDEHTVMICDGGFLHSSSGFLFTDGKEYEKGFCDNTGNSGFNYDNIYISGNERIYSWCY